MSSGSVMGRCRMTVPAAEKMTTRMMRMTPVLIELRVCQILRLVERSDRAISFSSSFASVIARSAPTEATVRTSFTFNALLVLAGSAEVLRMRHNTQGASAWLGIHPLAKPCDCNHKRGWGTCAISPVPVRENAHSGWVGRLCGKLQRWERVSEPIAMQILTVSHRARQPFPGYGHARAKAKVQW